MKEFDQLIGYLLMMVYFSEEEIKLFTKNMRVKKYKKSTFLLEEGKIANAIYFINKGITRNLSIKSDGKEFTQYFSLENTFITEYASFLNKTTAIYSIQCVEDCEIPTEYIQDGYLHIKEGDKFGRLVAEDYFT